ncbi:DUF2953 domain-containing protein [Clostridium sp. C2-6-12]|uniref:DUF2953 domain-containing protein n=1 Tax=Clostridium sp. C2-6-12 TaxID=2698832 RepID=UPI00136D6B66|nr:DUF2953 domain-containing protein [Clostridium sp. C2-6-12]
MTFLIIILKIFFILMLILLSILVLTLFIPFNYCMNGKIEGHIVGGVDIRWLFGLVKVIVCKYEDKPEIKLVFCGLNIFSKKLIEDNEKNQKKPDKKEKSKKKYKSKRSFGKDLLIEFFKYFKDIINIVKPKYFKISGAYGFEDPSLTGMVLGIISIIKGAVPKAQIYVEPDFEEELINIEVEINGDIKVYVICYRTLKLIIKKEIRKFLFKKSKTVETF